MTFIDYKNCCHNIRIIDRNNADGTHKSVLAKCAECGKESAFYAYGINCFRKTREAAETAAVAEFNRRIK